jgi:hypothetical protein
MSRTRLLLAVSLLCFLPATPVQAGEAEEASMEILLDTLRSNKKAFVDVNLALTDEEARAFWPVYDRYQEGLTDVQRRLAQVIDEYSENFGSVSHERALQLVTEYMQIQQDQVALRQSYLEPISETLPGRKVMRFYQIENKIEAVLRYELAGTIPVVEQ